jgi:hypothetical protein
MGYLEQALEQSAALGGEVGKALDPAREWLARADQLNRELEQARAAEEADYAKLVEQAAATGKLPTLNGWGRWVYDSPSSKLVVAAVSVCHQKASTAAREAGPRIFEALQRRVKAVVDESAKLAATVPLGAVDETTALHAGNGDTKHHTTWRKLRALVDDWTRCFELLATTQRATWVDGPTHPRDRDQAVIFQRYLRPLSLPPGYWQGPGELRLAKAAATNAEPGMYPWADAVARWERIDRRQRDYGSMQVVQTHDAMGNVVASEASPERPFAFAPLGS